VSSDTPCPSANKIALHAFGGFQKIRYFSKGIAPMEGKELVVLRNEAIATLKSPLATEPAAVGDRKSLLPVFATSALFSVAAMMWLHILADTKTSPSPSVQSVLIQAQTPPPEAEDARRFETMAAVDDVERAQQVAVATAGSEPALPKFQAWAAQKNVDVPTETTHPPKIAPEGDAAQAKASAAQDREREQEALADKRWEERHARHLADRKSVRRTPQPPQQQAQKPQQHTQQVQKPQQPAPTATAAPVVAPQASDSWRGGG
jgi:hypothetical protein